MYILYHSLIVLKHVHIYLHCMNLMLSTCTGTCKYMYSVCFCNQPHRSSFSDCTSTCLCTCKMCDISLTDVGVLSGLLSGNAHHLSQGEEGGGQQRGRDHHEDQPQLPTPAQRASRQQRPSQVSDAPPTPPSVLAFTSCLLFGGFTRAVHAFVTSVAAR